MNPQLVISRFTASTAVAATAVALATAGAGAAGSSAKSVESHAFTASHTGWVRAVDVTLDGGSVTHAGVAVVIRALNPGGEPTRTVLAGTSTAAADGRIRVQLPTPPAVHAGTSYSLTVSAPSGTRIGSATPVYGSGSAAPFCHAA